MTQAEQSACVRLQMNPHRVIQLLKMKKGKTRVKVLQYPHHQTSSICSPSIMDDSFSFLDQSSCSSSNTSFDGEAEVVHNSNLPTDRIVGDNIDKNVKPRDVRMDSQTVSLHYYHSYALRDRIDLSSFDDSSSSPDISEIDFSKFLPSSQDHDAVSHLITRILCKDMPFFAKYGKGLEKHIRHEYSNEMSRKSEVVKY